uniref:Reverse transcriptase domain-containing protein n=1 Tax=Strongyloides venezuelensis TaxID=75913 RepID=A0A0K0FHG9_STRVS
MVPPIMKEKTSSNPFIILKNLKISLFKHHTDKARLKFIFSNLDSTFFIENNIDDFEGLSSSELLTKITHYYTDIIEEEFDIYDRLCLLIDDLKLDYDLQLSFFNASNCDALIIKYFLEPISQKFRQTLIFKDYLPDSMVLSDSLSAAKEWDKLATSSLVRNFRKFHSTNKSTINIKTEFNNDVVKDTKDVKPAFGIRPCHYIIQQASFFNIDDEALVDSACGENILSLNVFNKFTRYIRESLDRNNTIDIILPNGSRISTIGSIDVDFSCSFADIHCTSLTFFVYDVAWNFLGINTCVKFRLLSKLEAMILENEPLLRDTTSMLCNISTESDHKDSIYRINKFLEQNLALWDDSPVTSKTFVRIPFPENFVPSKALLIRFAKHLRFLVKVSSQSDQISNAFTIKQQGKNPRLVVNPKNLNNQIVIPSNMTHKMITTKDIQEKLANYYKNNTDYCFSTFDIKSAYRNCRLYPDQSKYLQHHTDKARLKFIFSNLDSTFFIENNIDDFEGLSSSELLTKITHYYTDIIEEEFDIYDRLCLLIDDLKIDYDLRKPYSSFISEAIDRISFFNASNCNALIIKYFLESISQKFRQSLIFKDYLPDSMVLSDWLSAAKEWDKLATSSLVRNFRKSHSTNKSTINIKTEFNNDVVKDTKDVKPAFGIRPSLVDSACGENILSLNVFNKFTHDIRESLDRNNTIDIILPNGSRISTIGSIDVDFSCSFADIHCTSLTFFVCDVAWNFLGINTCVKFRLLSKLEAMILESEPLLRDTSSMLCYISTESDHKDSIYRINKFLEQNPALWDDSPVTSKTFVRIPFPENFVPSKAPLIRFAKHLRDASKDILDNDVRKGFLVKVSSQSNQISNAFTIKQQGKNPRLVVNPKNLNNQIVIPSNMTHKMITTKDIQEKLANYYKNSTDYCFSTFDIKSAYRNCRLYPDQSKYLQFVTEFGTCEPTSLIFGDDGLVFTKNKDHANVVIEILSRLVNVGWKITHDKCQWMKDEVEFIGLTISKNGISIPEHKKVQYRSFSHPTKSMIPEFSNITDIQVSDRSICSSLYWHTKSNKGLFDLQGRTLKESEINYLYHNKFLLAVKENLFANQKFILNLPVFVITNNSPLKSVLDNSPDMFSAQGTFQRLRLFLEYFDVRFIYSRDYDIISKLRIDSIPEDFTQPITQCAMKELAKIDDVDSCIDLNSLIVSYASDPFAPILIKIAKDSNNVIRINNKIYLPQLFQNNILSYLHMYHRSSTTMIHLAKTLFVMINCTSLIRQYYANCKTCMYIRRSGPSHISSWSKAEHSRER